MRNYSSSLARIAGPAAGLAAAVLILLLLWSAGLDLFAAPSPGWIFAAQQWAFFVALAAGTVWVLARHGYARFLDVCGLVAGGILAILAVLVTMDVVFRNIGWFTFPWLLEIAEYGIYLSTMLAAPWVLRLGAHVRVDVLVNAVPRPAARLMEIAADVLGAAVSMVVLYYGVVAAWQANVSNSFRRVELVVPEWWLLIAIPFAAVLLLIEFGLRIRRTVAHESDSDDTAALRDGL